MPIVFLTVGMAAQAQYVSFEVAWSGCNVQITGSEYFVQYAIYNTITGSFEVTPTWHDGSFQHTVPSGVIEIDNWDCNQADTVPYLYIFVYVELRKDGIVYCSGNGRSNKLTCIEMYDSATTINVNMGY